MDSSLRAQIEEGERKSSTSLGGAVASRDKERTGAVDVRRLISKATLSFNKVGISRNWRRLASPDRRIGVRSRRANKKGRRKAGPRFRDVGGTKAAIRRPASHLDVGAGFRQRRADFEAKVGKGVLFADHR